MSLASFAWINLLRIIPIPYVAQSWKLRDQGEHQCPMILPARPVIVIFELAYLNFRRSQSELNVIFTKVTVSFVIILPFFACVALCFVLFLQHVLIVLVRVDFF